eukprot:TRINITY_DN14773_c0_g1_i1.p1 TRINITY_DN14773_c0_g1~~TRINITY_DN14773_c0_g1_i1.p1  ORF type:complete len:248 (-),score=26.61 TRINITY_DN14773_c0_g1_i1:594-1337(-)
MLRLCVRRTFLDMACEEELPEVRRRSRSSPPAARGRKSGTEVLEKCTDEAYCQYLTAFMASSLRSDTSVTLHSGVASEAKPPSSDYVDDERRSSRASTASTRNLQGSMGRPEGLPHGGEEDDACASLPLPPDAKTLMLCNLPCRMMIGDVVAMLQGLGYNGTFNYVKVPTKVSRSSLGYAFVDFTSAPTAHAFARDFLRHRFEGHKSNKVPSVRVATIQSGNDDAAGGEDHSFRPNRRSRTCWYANS